MAKRKATINSSEDLAPPETRLLRSRKRKSSLTDDVQAPLHQQLSSTVTVVVTPLPSPQSSPLQECVMTVDQQDEAAQQSGLTNQHSSNSEKQTEATNKAENDHSTVTEEDKTTVIGPVDDSQLEHLNKHTDDDTSMREKNKKEIGSEESKRSPDQRTTDQLCVPEDSDGSCTNALKNLERNQNNSQEAAGLPAKKKQRLGVCGLTEKERRQILLIQNCENGEKIMERGEICNDTAEPVITSSPQSNITEQNETEPKLQSSHCEENDRKETEVTASEETKTASDIEGQSCGGEGDIAPDPEQTGNPESDIPTEKAGQEGLGNQLLEFRGPADEIIAEKPETHGMEDASELHTIQKKEEVNQESAELQMINVTETRDEKKEEEKEEEMTSDAVSGGECVSSLVDQSGGLNCESVEVCEATVTPNISEQKPTCETDGEPAAGSSTVCTEETQSMDTPDPFGSGCSDYVSDSQLNTIVLIDEVVMEKETKKNSSDCQEVATDLIQGLIRELSSLNRRVMAAHRELENLRRSSKGSRSCIR